MSLTPEQIALRRTRIGASEMGALLGLDPYKSAHDVFLAKVLPADAADKPHTSWGLDLEPAILAHHARVKGYELLTPPGSLVHPAAPLVCTPDGLARAAGSTIDLQAKNDQGRGQIEWGEPGTDDAPQLYLAQVTIELGVLRATGYDVSHGELVVSIRGAPPVAYRVDFDAELFGALSEIAARFVRDHLETGKPPDGASPQERSEYLRRRFARETAPVLEPTPELTALVQSVAWLRQQKRALEADLIAAENRLKEAIGDAAGVAGLCTYRTQKGSTYQVVKKACRVLRIAKKEGENHADAEA